MLKVENKFAIVKHAVCIGISDVNSCFSAPLSNFRKKKSLKTSSKVENKNQQKNKSSGISNVFQTAGLFWRRGGPARYSPLIRSLILLKRWGTEILHPVTLLMHDIISEEYGFKNIQTFFVTWSCMDFLLHLMPSYYILEHLKLVASRGRCDCTCTENTSFFQHKTAGCVSF